MYCPQCSNEQVVPEQRFCSRCGFPLTIVSQLVRNAGALKGLDLEGNPVSPETKRIRTGALLMLIGGLLTPTAALLTAMKSDLVFMFAPVLMVFLAGLALMLYAIVRQRASSPVIAAKETSRELPFSHPHGLPTYQSIPISPGRQPVTTSDMAQPRSVTEDTTKVLDQKQQRN